MTTPRGVSAGSFADTFLAALDLGAPRPMFRVLDVGTGSARIPIEVCTRRSGIDVIGIDCRPGILRRAQRDIHRARLGKAVRVHGADACALPYADFAFDGVISNSLLHHVPRRLGALREMIRVLKSDGLLFVRDALPQSDAATIADVLSRSARSRGARPPREIAGIFAGPLTIDEARTLASAAGLPAEWVRPSGPRHWLLSAWQGQPTVLIPAG